MYLLVLYFPLISFIFSFLVGRTSNNYYIGFFTSLRILSSFITSIFIFYEVILCYSPTYVYCMEWISTDIVEIQWHFTFDNLTSIMLIVILAISTCAHFYSIEYTLYDPHQIKFMSYLSLFTFFMILLVTSSNFILLFLGWEGVGICSYLLINFWHTRIAANKSAIMAMYVNKIGDVSLLIAFSLLFFIFHNFDYSTLFLSIQATMYNGLSEFDKNNTYLLYFICFSLIVGAVGKSAQLGLHTWLPEAMEGPTPVSSLIHAATMVTAGIFAIIRSNLLFQWCNDITIIIIALGSLTAFVGSTIGIFQSDIKKIIAYSTCSQLGYMFLACGLNGFNFSLYHSTNHAFFKALLFLVAGYIIHAINNEQDIRNLGGLLHILPFAYTGLTIGSLSLLGFPFTSGFFSKEKIIELFYSFMINHTNQIIYVNILYFFSLLASISVTFTILYSIKIIVNVFYYTFQTHYTKLVNLHYSTIVTTIPFLFLSVLSIVSGYLLEDLMVGVSTTSWNYFILFLPTFEIFNLNDFEFNLLSSKLPIISILFFSILFFIYYYCFENTLYYLKIQHISFEIIYKLLNRKYFIFNKNVYYPIINFVFLKQALICWLFIDKGLIEVLGPFGLTKLVSKLILRNSNYQTGLIYHYFITKLIGYLLILYLFFFLTNNYFYFLYI